MDVTAWQTAGFWEDDTRPVERAGWELPEWVTVEGDRLVYGGLRLPERARGRMLEAFLRLARPAAADAHIAAFARRWGVLGLCEQHGLPAAHCYPDWPSSDGACEPPITNDGASYWESLAVWRQYARHALAVVNIAVALQSGKLGELDDWRSLYRNDVVERLHKTPSGRRAAIARGWLAQQVNWWLNVGNVRPWLSWPAEGDMHLSLAGGVYGNPAVSGLAGELGIQLLQVVSRTERPAFCSACGAAYLPSRRPRAGRRTYCDDCRATGAPQRDAARDSYRRRHAASKSG